MEDSTVGFTRAISGQFYTRLSDTEGPLCGAGRIGWEAIPARVTSVYMNGFMEKFRDEAEQKAVKFNSKLTKSTR